MGGRLAWIKHSGLLEKAEVAVKPTEQSAGCALRPTGSPSIQPSGFSPSGNAAARTAAAFGYGFFKPSIARSIMQ